MTSHSMKKKIRSYQRRQGYVIQSLTHGVDQWFLVRDDIGPHGTFGNV